MPTQKSSGPGGPKRFSFTQKRLDELPVPESGRVTYRDEKTPGLCIRVSSTGSAAAYLSRKVKGRHIKVRLGAWPGDFSSVKKLREIAEDAMAGGVDALAAMRRQSRQAATLGDLWTRWEEYAAGHKKPKSQSEDRRQYETFLAKWARRPLSEICRSDVAGLHSRIGRTRGNYAANRCRALLSAMYGIAADLGYEGPNPCDGVKKFPEQSRERFLQPDEMKRFFGVLAEEEPRWRDYFLLLLFSGARRSNVAAMRWDQIDLAAAAWYLPGESMKGGEPIVVVLPEPALAVLRARLTASDGSEWVFPAGGKAGHIVDPRKAWARVVKRAEIDNLRMHDLRRSLGSWQAAMGSSLHIIGKSLGHRDHKATQVYARLQLDPVRQSVEGATTAMIEAGGVVVDAEGIKLTGDREG